MEAKNPSIGFPKKKMHLSISYVHDFINTLAYTSFYIRVYYNGS